MAERPLKKKELINNVWQYLIHHRKNPVYFVGKSAVSPLMVLFYTRREFGWCIMYSFYLSAPAPFLPLISAQIKPGKVFSISNSLPLLGRLSHMPQELSFTLPADLFTVEKSQYLVKRMALQQLQWVLLLSILKVSYHYGKLNSN